MDFVDANIVLRYILKDDESQSEKSRLILETKDVIITFEVVAEVVYVLLKGYRVPRKQITSSLSLLFALKSIKALDKEVMVSAIDLFSSTTFDFVDCVLISYNNIRGFVVHTFDRQIKKRLK